MVDLKKRTVTLPETKNGEKRVVPLSTEAVRVLAGLSRRIDGEVWEMEPDSITQAFLRALSRARKAYEKECTEKKEKPDPVYLVDLTFHDLSASHQPEGRIGVRQKHGGKGQEQETLPRVFRLGRVRRGGIDKTDMSLVR